MNNEICIEELEFRELDLLLDSAIAEDDILETLQFSKIAIESSNMSEDIVNFLLANESFVSVCGSTPDRWIESIDNKLEELTNLSVASEGMGWQDFLRYGSYGIIFGAYFGNMNRIKSRISAGISKDRSEEQIKGQRSLYLPSASETKNIQNVLKDLSVSIVQLLSDFENTSIDKIKAEMAKLNNIMSAASTDWRAVIGSIVGGGIGAWLASFIDKRTVGVGILVGRAVGGHLASKNGAPIGKRGWNKANLEAAGKEMIKFIDTVEGAKDKFTTIKGTMKSTEDKAKLKEIKEKYTNLKKVLKMYMLVSRTVGRGLAAALND